MRLLVRELQQRLRITTVFVTHDQREAMAVADRIALLLDGRIEQSGESRDLLLNPHSARAARFFGWMILSGDRNGQMVSASAGDLKLPHTGEAGQCYVAFRPENVRLCACKEHGGSLTGTLESLIDYGARWQWRVRLPGGEVIEADQERQPCECQPRVGDQIKLFLPESAIRCYAAIRTEGEK
jgi:ABC-type Fe3+/spermidine/putrescine transport system ATPase subunit